MFRPAKPAPWLSLLASSIVMLSACSEETAQVSAPAGAAPAQVASVAATSTPSLGVRPHGDTTRDIDMSRIHSEDLKKVFSYIDEHIDEYVINLQKWIQQP